jgi:hypothetical protein
MKKFKILFCLIVVVLFTTSAWAGPFWVCAPQKGVSHYVITGDVNDTTPAQDLGDGTVRVHYDLASLADGNYTCDIKAVSVWGESAPVPFYFNKILPECPSAMDISAQ